MEAIGQQKAVVNKVISLQVLYKMGNSKTSCVTISFHGKTVSWHFLYHGLFPEGKAVTVATQC
jgi:negative regulator of replication initiation